MLQLQYIPVFILAFGCIQTNAFLNLDVKSWKICPEYSNQLIKHSATFEKINSTAILTSGEVSSPIDLGIDVTFKILIERFTDGKWKEHSTLVRKDPCTVFHQYGGDMWYELQEAAGIPKGVCPLPKGTYKVKNHILDLTKLPDKFGLRAPYRATALVRKDDEVLLCVKCEIDNY